jgi:glycerol-3-phosphate dehydrogenase (NAD+)
MIKKISVNKRKLKINILKKIRYFLISICSVQSVIQSVTMSKVNVSIIGSGNWGSAISKIVGLNAKRLPEFEGNYLVKELMYIIFNNALFYTLFFYLDRVYMYVFEEIINGRKLTEIINETHENIKYLPGHRLPDNVLATSDIIEAGRNADILIFVLPHQYISKIGAQLGNTYSLIVLYQ